ncbi:MAG: DUF2812 domain-containing protein [Ruminococcus sp.]|nr:DUF2812 domain-containing protein [Ruminococcus sp.]
MDMDNKKKKTKRTFKRFYLWDYDKEEQYCNDMHAKGWKLVPPSENDLFATFGGQKFEECEPENVVYKIGFNPKRSERESYIQMFEDYGWEPCGSLNDFYYFRKNADGVSPEELDIFSDDESRLDMAKKILRTKLPIMLILTVCLIPQSFRVIFMEDRNAFDRTLLVMYGGCWVLYANAFIKTYLSYQRFRRKFGDDDDRV